MGQSAERLGIALPDRFAGPPCSELHSKDCLTGNHKVPYYGHGTLWFPISKMKSDAIFRALADPSRRKLLDRLHQKNGQTLAALCRGLNMTRQAVAKHLGILRKANLVSWKREGRERLHFINPVPINEIAERWINKFEYPHLRALSNLKKGLEGEKDE
jgi:DNA-binding transcriptional ArsR family regulator